MPFSVAVLFPFPRGVFFPHRANMATNNLHYPSGPASGLLFIRHVLQI